ncbi:hypothetical protein ACQY0O_000693 [Thecaphora frezii]
MVSWLVVLPLGVLALHYRSLPFAWHVRMLVTEVRARWRTTSRFKLIGANRGQRVQASSPHLLLDALPIGRDVFTDVVVEDFRVGFDDGDFLGHLSNSCYAKNLDYARMSYASSRLPLFFRDNGWIALGAIQFKYLHEIPIGAKYQIRMATLGWDDKWFCTSPSPLPRFQTRARLTRRFLLPPLRFVLISLLVPSRFTCTDSQTSAPSSTRPPSPKRATATR